MNRRETIRTTIAALAVMAALAIGYVGGATERASVCFPVGGADVDALPANLVDLGVDYHTSGASVCVADKDVQTVVRERAAIGAAGGYIPG